MASIAQLRKDKNHFYKKNNLKEVANTCNLLGTELQDVGEYDLALKEHQEEASIFETHQDLIGVAIAHRRMGEVYCELRKWDEALQHQKKHLSLAKEVENMVEQQRAYATIGRTYMQIAEELAIEDDKADHFGALHDSQNAFFKALATCDNISREVDSSELAQMRARLYHNIGLVLDMKDDVSGALKFVSQALELCNSYNLTDDAYRAYSELSRMHLKLGSAAKAMQEAQLSLNLATKMQNKRFTIDAHHLIAQIYLCNDDFLAARKSSYKAFKIRHPAKEVRSRINKNLKQVVSLCIYKDQISKLETDAETQLRGLDKIGDILCNFGLFKEAIVFYQKRLELALESNKESYFLAPIYTSLAQTYKDSKQLDKALEYFQKELSIHLNNNPKEAVVTLIEMAKVSEMMPQNENENCSDFYEQALKIAIRVNSFQLKIIVLRNYVVSAQIPSQRRENLRTELDELHRIHGSDVGYEESETGSEAEDEINLDLIEFSDSEEDERSKHPRVSRISSGFRLKVNAMGESPLHQAVIKGNVSMVKRLLEQNHPVNARDNSGWLPIHEACNWGYFQIAELLIESGAWVNDSGGEECSGTTPLHDAATNGHFDVIELLVENGSSVLLKDAKGDTPLNCLAKFAERSDSNNDLEQCRRIQAILIERMERAGYKVPGRLKAPFALEQNNGYLSRGECSYATRSSIHEQPEEEEEGSLDLISVLVNEFDCSSSRSSLRSSAKFFATDTYKTAIKSVGSHSRKFDVPHHVASTSSKDFNRNPLIPEKDYVNEDWLIDDMESGTKKRKRLDKFEYEYKDKARRKWSPEDQRVIPKKVKQSKLTTLFKKSSRRRCNEFDNEDNACFNGGADDDDDDEEISSSQKAIRLNPETSQFSSSSLSPLRLHVKVLSKKMLVPVAPSSQKNTIRWLEREVCRRYFQLTGVKPMLKLSTMQDEVLNPDDTIDLTLSADNSELQATITGIQDLPSLPDRYAQMCQGSNLVPLSDVSSHLKDCDSSGQLDLSRSYLRDEKDLEAIFSSLHHQNIQVLSLSSCRIQDAGISNLIQCMASLSLLQKVELEACSLSSESLEVLCSFLKEQKPFPKKFSHLNLGYNDFSDAKFSHLKSLLTSPCLHELKLNCCGMRLTAATPSSDSPLTSNVRFLDLSENELSLVVFSSVVSTCPYLTHLWVRGCISKYETFPYGATTSSSSDSFSGPSLGTGLSGLLGGGSECFLEHLDISSCDVTNQDLDILGSFLYRCASISSLNLSRNPRLSPSSVTKLVQEMNKTCVSLKELRLHGIETLAQDSMFTECLSSTIEKRASSLHPFVSLSFPYSDMTEKLSQLWLKLYEDKAIMKTFSKAIFLTVECSS